tara:strand:- start:24 stop:1823 length:1800 start_codon:yes stop_codon:yes gene_type:complete
MPGHNKKKVPIKYTDREFNSIKKSLIEHARRYYPNTYQDFNEASFGSLMIDLVSYVGDVLSFYLDFQANESFMDTAVEYDNIVKLAKQMGYKFRDTPSSTGIVSFYCVVPAMATGFGPDLDYMPVLKKGTELANNAGTAFVLVEDVDFSRSNNEMVVARVDEDTGAPTSYAIKSFGQVVSGQLLTQTIQVGSFERLKRLELEALRVTEVVSVFDSEGHEYFEVDYLSQDVVYREILNPNASLGAPTILLRPQSVPRRFTVEQEGEITFLQFGFGSEESISTDPLTRASEVVLQAHGKNYSTSKNFDPSNLKSTDKLGVAPANTTLTITYRVNTTENVNAATNTVNNISNRIVRFNKPSLVPSKVSDVLSSFECTNEEPIIGDAARQTADEIKRHAIDAYASQNRAVTAQDYASVVYRMPGKFGKVKRCTVLQDTDSLKRNLNLFVISTDENNRLIQTNRTVKDNLRFWINDYKMISDTIDILDAKIINIGINFMVTSEDGFDKYETLESCRAELTEYFNSHFEIGEPLYITKLYQMLNNVEGVLDTINIEIVSKVGSRYSTTFFDVEENMSNDGRILFVPEDSILEVKLKPIDIVGVIK